ncbi:MAG TPA: hypothetical protein VNT26_06005, partial [Candidatus Sulfotelmatobacter sp.]|nr:hypothetical protein [Candidatus Sulfotelmatobacter sp.]
MSKLYLVGCLAVWLPGVSLAQDDGWDAGPLYDEFNLTLTPGHRTEAAGPFYYREQQETQRTWAVPPLLSYTVDPALELKEFDFLYPILTYDRYGGQYRWQLFQLLAFAGGPTQLETTRKRFTIFPFYFQQRSSDPSQNYTAYGPFYGNLKNRLMRDEIHYVMFPFYSQTRKKDVVTDNYVYPFFHLRHGPGLKGWQFWPVVGHEHKEVTTRTNTFGDPEMVPGHDSWFALWPIYHNTYNGIGSTNIVWDQGVLPFYELTRSPQRDQTTVLWPFFTRIDEREKKYREWQVPWPFIDIARGEGKTITRVWPFYSQAHSSNVVNHTYMWPVYRYNEIHAAPLERKRTRIFYFLYSDNLEENTETHKFRRRVDLWPFFTHRRDFNGNRRLQVLAPLEPATPGSHKIERDWSPVWSLWRAESNPTTQAASQSLLWNLYRRETAPAHKKVSLLFGLFQYEKNPAGKGVRLFY